jgi:hypothetical protein
MTGYLNFKGIRIFDYTIRAEPLREQVRTNAQRLAQEAGLEIQFLKRCDERKEALVRKILAQRGTHEGLVCIFSAMEACSSYTPWHDKVAHKTFLKGDSGKCLHYYFYFIDKGLGLCYLRVPTWAPFRLQFYFNGHNALCAALDKRQIEQTMLDNAFGRIGDWDKAQKLADAVDVEKLHRKLDRFARRYCPPIALFPDGYHFQPDAGGVCHRHRLQAPRGPGPDLRGPDAHGRPCRQGRARGHLPGPQAARQLRGRGGQPFRDPHPGRLHQAPYRRSLDQDG